MKYIRKNPLQKLTLRVIALRVAVERDNSGEFKLDGIEDELRKARESRKRAEFEWASALVRAEAAMSSALKCLSRTLEKITDDGKEDS